MSIFTRPQQVGDGERAPGEDAPPDVPPQAPADPSVTGTAAATAGVAAPVAEPVGEPGAVPAGADAGGAGVAVGDGTADARAGSGPSDPVEEGTAARSGGARRRGPVRRAFSWLLTLGSVGVLMIALLVPDRISHTRPGDLLRIPGEAVLGAVLVLVLPRRSGRVVIALGALVLALLNFGKILDTGFQYVFQRQFDPTVDWTLLADGVDFLNTSVSQTAGVGAVVGVAVLVPLGVAVTVLSALRLSNLVVRHRDRSRLVVGVVTGLYLLCLALNLQVFPNRPLASRAAVSLLHQRWTQVRTSLRDQAAVTREAAVDPFRNVPADQLLTGLRGKNVIFAFVESYGRSALTDPAMGPGIDALLDSGSKTLAADGYAARSGWLTSSTYGGGSWLAHSTLLSGLWIDGQGKYMQVTATDRMTLNKAFRKAGWWTVGIEPSIRKAWPEGRFYGYDQLYTLGNLGYRGPKFGYATTTDQYILSTFQRRELAVRKGPVMGELVLLSSHVPWAPLPQLIDWNQVGDGSVYLPMPAKQPGKNQVWQTSDGIRRAYQQSVEYSLNTIMSFLKTYGDKNTVLVFLGDHQPASVVTLNKYGRDVPITVVAKDPAVLDRISSWNWTPGLRPAPNAPVWRMNAFRDKFLTAFSSPAAAPSVSLPGTGGPAPAPSASAPAGSAPVGPAPTGSAPSGTSTASSLPAMRSTPATVFAR